MDINLRLYSPFDAVFLINGRLCEGGIITYGDNEVVYITILPLDAVLLPYTVKLVGSEVKSNNGLCGCYRLENGRYYLKLEPRYNYVYSVAPLKDEKPKGIAEKFFCLILEKKPFAARECLSEELNASIDDASLTAFFDGYKDIIPYNPEGGLYFLISLNGSGVLYSFEIKNNLIDNIIEKTP